MKNDESVVIIEVNKERAVVIMDSVHYDQLIYKQLENENQYKKVDPSGDTKTISANNPLNKKYENSFLKQDIDYLTTFIRKTVIFMVLLKSINLKLSP